MAGFTLTQIKTFLMVYKTTSFQAAANALHTTQPAVSQRIKELERILGLELFLREPRNARLTMAGRKMLPYAERMVALADEISAELMEKHAVSGLLKIGATDTVALTWLPRLVQKLRQEFPRLEVELVVGLSVDLLEELKNHDLDIAMLACPVDHPEIAAAHMGMLRNCWMAAPSLVAEIGEITPHTMSRLPLFTYSEGSHQHQMIKRWFREEGLDSLRINVCTNLAAIMKLTIEGLGVSILSPEMMADELAAGVLQVIEVGHALPPIEFAAAYMDSDNTHFLRHLAGLAAVIVADDKTFGNDLACADAHRLRFA